MTHHLVGTAEIAKMLGVSRQRVDQLVDSYEDFPAPEAELAAGRVWSRKAVEEWMTDNFERGPGRPAPRRKPKEKGMFERFTDRARRVVVLAQEEARRLNHNYIGTEHLLLGLMAEADGLADRALRSFDLTLEVLRRQVVQMIGRGSETPKGHIPFTPRAKKSLELALSEALKLDHDYIGTEHLLLGLLEEGKGVAVQALKKMGLTVAGVRSMVIGMIRGQGDPAPRIEVSQQSGSVLIVGSAPTGTPTEEITRSVQSALREKLEGRAPDQPDRLTEVLDRLKVVEERLDQIEEG